MQHLKPEELRLLLQLEDGAQKDALLLDAVAVYDPVGSNLPVAGSLPRDSYPSMPASLPKVSGESPSSGYVSTAKEVCKPKPRATKVNAKESHKRYRERVKNKADETKAEYARLVEEIANAKLEQAQLQSENTVLEHMCRYADSALSLIRNAASSISTLASDSAWQIQGAARARMMVFYRDIVESIWTRFIRPSDDQLRAMIKEGAHLSAMREAFIDRLCLAITEWQTASPAGRELIERKLYFAFQTRARVCKMLLKEQPEKMQGLFPTIPDSHPPLANKNSFLYEKTRAQLVCNEDLIAATALTEEQSIALQRHWKIYLAHFNKTKAVVKQSKIDVETNLETTRHGALPHEPISSLSQAAKSHVALHESSATLNKLTNEEMVARMNLGLGGLAVLRPIQQAFIMVESLPKTDCVMDVVECYKSLLRMEGANSIVGIRHENELAGRQPNSFTSVPAIEQGAFHPQTHPTAGGGDLMPRGTGF